MSQIFMHLVLKLRYRIAGAFLVFPRWEFANVPIPPWICCTYRIVRAFRVFDKSSQIYLFPHKYAVPTESFAISAYSYSEFARVSIPALICCRESFRLSGLHGLKLADQHQQEQASAAACTYWFPRMSCLRCRRRLWDAARLSEVAHHHHHSPLSF